MVDQFIASQSKSPEGMKAEVATYGLLPGAMEAMKLQLQTESIARANNRAGPGCLDSAPLDLSGFLPGYAERGALRFCRCVGRA
ncbi:MULTISPECIES: hypothetical protein [Bradyrhizobium]|uniref:hypothetical protein n=1 Tax=Bradyrhizobium TaxID=374 RepID=UPI001BACED97|nr:MULTISPECIES: hypothetical protein [Bradyrhizobium]MBR0884839.1 hypothetical protein [Bradyrhizobium liaoningense]MCP1783530.1 hypothetical protein [Bradyrhizobium japonicum]MCP1896790.1 hypothetical protein [Bradyrhizobium japonicum]MCP1964179.1 hypothetical protein [Bradyrhizobium japonicum]